MNSIDKLYQALLQDILDNGVRKGDRTGTGTISVFGRQIRHKMSEGFPLLTTKKMAWKTMVTELLWFLRGDTNIKYLVDNGCHIWDGDAYKAYKTKIIKMVESWDAKYHEVLKSEANGNRPFTQEEFIERIKTDGEFAKKWGELGPLYGKQWRAWNHFISTGDPIIKSVESEDSIAVSVTPQGIECEIDQIKNLIKDLKANPDSRRLMVSAWNVGELDSMVLPPCHYLFQVWTRELTFEERWDLAKERGLVGKDAIIPTPDATYLGLNQRSEIECLWNDTVLKTDLPKRAISLMWNQRSVDTFLGLPFNIASYALLLEIIAKEVNMIPDELIGNLGDVHIYSNHIEQAKEQIGREPMKLPTLKIADHTPQPSIIEKTKYWRAEDFTIENYQSHPSIKAPLSN